MNTYLNQLPFFNYLLITIIIWGIIIILKKNIENKIVLLIEIFYIIIVSTILFYPENTLSTYSIKANYFQLLPFKTISEYIINKNYFAIIGNIFILLPIPIFLYIHKISLKKNVVTSFLIATAVEPIQILINVITKYSNKIIDVDDFILYIIGVLIGFILLLLNRIIKNK